MEILWCGGGAWSSTLSSLALEATLFIPQALRTIMIFVFPFYIFHFAAWNFDFFLAMMQEH
jgi:hypothetical protein